ncbi:MAG: hypothetical protein H0W14_13615, partial [Actinobacteria bacterium]|nr:hypothetical protein [Actinomycetota bacterium]
MQRDALYVGGFFERVDGVRRDGIAAVDAKDGRVLPWHVTLAQEPGGFGGPAVSAIATTADAVYFSGNFATVNDVQRAGLAAAATAGSVTAWNPRPDGYVSSLAVARDALYVGGSFSRIGGEQRSALAAVDLDEGKVQRFAPALMPHGRNRELDVGGIAVDGGSVYAV